MNSDFDPVILSACRTPIGSFGGRLKDLSAVDLAAVVIREANARARVTPVLAEEVSWRGDAIEAECFAFLAVRVLRGLPLSFPLTTGVRTPTPGGRLAKAKAAA